MACPYMGTATIFTASSTSASRDLKLANDDIRKRATRSTHNILSWNSLKTAFLKTVLYKFLDKESSSHRLDLSPGILEELKKKHLPASKIEDECLLNGSMDQIPSDIFDLIGEQMISGPSEMDQGLYRRILCLKNFSS